MCGIVGYVGGRPCRDLLFEGLRKLEYRGYDSAGIALLEDGQIETVRAVGNLDQLEAALQKAAGNGGGAFAGGEDAPAIGIAHTRWATHGRVTEANAHPHSDPTGTVQIVLNGIVENHAELKRDLAAAGNEFSSETDAEIVAHLIARHYDGDFPAAVRAAFGDMRGHYAFVALHAAHPHMLVGARQECPLVVGRGDGENFLASAIPAFLHQTRTVQVLENGDIVVLTPEGVEVIDAEGGELSRGVEEITWDEDQAEKGGYATFMLKEIHEQPDAVAETIADRLASGTRAEIPDVELTEDQLRGFRRIVIVACGTSYHAGMVGRYALETWCRIPVEMDVASEFRYRDPVVGEGDLVVAISQSGETADTLAAMRLARQKGATVLAVTNVIGSQATRDSDAVLFTRAGIEISVAATKTFVSQAAALYVFALRLAEVRGTLEAGEIAGLVEEMRAMPSLIERLIDERDEQVRAIARSHFEKEFFMFVGRHSGVPVALEGALKMKEITYIASDAYAAGEMKHGPIAMLDESTPVVAVATDSPVIEKVLSNVEEVRARGADVVAVATEGNEAVAEVADQTIFVPRTDWMLQPILAIVPLQLLAYYIARYRELNVDQPRNLAKTVTVE